MKLGDPAAGPRCHDLFPRNLIAHIRNLSISRIRVPYLSSGRENLLCLVRGFVPLRLEPGREAQARN